DDPELTYIFVPQLIGDDTFSGQLEREKGEHTGDYVITQGSLALSDNYSIAFETGTFTIVPADYKGISFGNASFVYDGVEHRLELTGELPEGVTVSYSIDGKAGNTAVDAGSYEVVALIDGGDNFDDLELTATLTIAPLQINVTAEDKSKTYGMDDPELTYIFVPQLIGDDTFSGQLEREKGENIGAYTISKGTLSLNGNYAVSFSEGTFTIQDAVYTGIRFDNASFVYDG